MVWARVFLFHSKIVLHSFAYETSVSFVCGDFEVFFFSMRDLCDLFAGGR